MDSCKDWCLSQISAFHVRSLTLIVLALAIFAIVYVLGNYNIPVIENNQWIIDVAYIGALIILGIFLWINSST